MQTRTESKQQEGAAFESKGVVIPLYDLKGILTIPPTAKAIVLFAHGSGSSRLSARNTYVPRRSLGSHRAGPAKGSRPVALRRRQRGSGSPGAELGGDVADACEKDLLMVPEASHLIKEHGVLDVVIGAARQWFTKHMNSRDAA